MRTRHLSDVPLNASTQCQCQCRCQCYSPHSSYYREPFMFYTLHSAFPSYSPIPSSITSPVYRISLTLCISLSHSLPKIVSSLLLPLLSHTHTQTHTLILLLPSFPLHPASTFHIFSFTFPPCHPRLNIHKTSPNDRVRDCYAN